MAKADKKKEVQKLSPNFYKGYDMRWLKETSDHPDYNLVAEFEAKRKAK